MSIILETDNGWLIDHKESIEQSVAGCINLQNSVPVNLNCPSEMFAIDWPFKMDSQVNAEAARNSNKDVPKDDNAGVLATNALQDGHVRVIPEKRRKKRKNSKGNEGLIQAVLYHNKIAGHLKKCIQELLPMGFDIGYFYAKDSAALENVNNVLARSFAQKIETPDLLEFFTNAKDESLSSIKLSISKANLKFDVIVIDPPWENKSVKRKKMYNYISDYDLFKIPIPSLANPGCIVIIWTTNKAHQMKFVKEKLFQRWSVSWCTDWHWVKVTRQGQTIHDLDSEHKKPYENLILGIYGENNMSQRLNSHRVIISIPSGLHSHKPPLADILKPYISPDANCLELFARSLIPGWTCWGNEVIKWQFIDCFVKKETWEETWEET